MLFLPPLNQDAPLKGRKLSVLRTHRGRFGPRFQVEGKGPLKEAFVQDTDPDDHWTFSALTSSPADPTIAPDTVVTKPFRASVLR